MKDNTRTPEAKAKTLKRKQEIRDKRRQYVEADNAFACLLTYMNGGEQHDRQTNRIKTDNERTIRTSQKLSK